MSDLKLWNTRTRTKEVLAPIDPGNVRMYVCGPTVYDRAHMGNARPVLVFDVLFRLLRMVFGPDHVTYVRNFTDVDDKINAAALNRKEAGAQGSLEDLVRKRSDETIDWYLADMRALGALEPTHMPRATEFIGQMISMIETLIVRGHAYEAEGHVLFAVDSWRENYGKLSGRSVDDMIAGARVEVAPYKKNPMDFVLWKPSSDDLPGWDSPWGRGRPGWHIECSAMSRELLGESFDIHGGGNDLTFPHHENEIAQSQCAHPEGEFARVWMHNEMLQVEGRKMSKSLGNFFTVRDLLDQGVPGEVIRFVFLGTHYRKPMDWTDKKRLEAEAKLDLLADAARAALRLSAPPAEVAEHLPEAMRRALYNDLDTHGALKVLEETALTTLGIERGEISDPDPKQQATCLLSGMSVLGLYELLVQRSARRKQEQDLLDPIAMDMTVRYNLARKTKDFSEIDRLKQGLSEAGVEVRIGRDGVDLAPRPDFDPGKLEVLK